MRRGKIRINTLIKFVNLYFSSLERDRPLTLDEIAQEIGCSRGHAYNYRRALAILIPPGYFDAERRRGPVQQCLTQ